MRKIRRVELQQKGRDSLWILVRHRGKTLHFSGLIRNFSLLSNIVYGWVHLFSEFESKIFIRHNSLVAFTTNSSTIKPVRMWRVTRRSSSLLFDAVEAGKILRISHSHRSLFRPICHVQLLGAGKSKR
jgi:hypothetical protein